MHYNAMKELAKGFVLNLSSVATVRSGYPFRGKLPLASSGVHVIQMKNFAVSGVSLETLECVAVEKIKPDLLLKNGDILFLCRGAKNEALCLNGIKEKTVCTTQFFILRVNSKQVLPEFLAWLLNQKEAQSYFNSRTAGAMATVRNITRSVLEETPLTIPALDVQKRILEVVALRNKEEEIYSKLIQTRKNEVACYVENLLNKENN